MVSTDFIIPCKAISTQGKLIPNLRRIPVNIITLLFEHEHKLPPLQYTSF